MPNLQKHCWQMIQSTGNPTAIISTITLPIFCLVCLYFFVTCSYLQCVLPSIRSLINPFSKYLCSTMWLTILSAENIAGRWWAMSLPTWSLPSSGDVSGSFPFALLDTLPSLSTLFSAPDCINIFSWLLAFRRVWIVKDINRRWKSIKRIKSWSLFPGLNYFGLPQAGYTFLLKVQWQHLSSETRWAHLSQ